MAHTDKDTVVRTLQTMTVHTLGCKMNQYESTGMEELLLEKGLQKSRSGEDADIVIVNTCTVTGKSDQRSRQAIRRFRRQYPHSTLIVTGCLAQRFPKELAAMPEVDFVLGNAEKKKVDQLIVQLTRGERPASVAVTDISAVNEFTDFSLNHFSDYTRAFLKIQDGCHCECAYCAVRLARGPSRSLPLPKIMEQVATLVANGYREIVLTGINLGAYGREIDPPFPFWRVVKQLLESFPETRFRLSSLEPQEWNSELIDLIKDYPTLCDHFHIPLQSASDELLKKMNRRYSFSEYQRLVDTLLRAAPKACIGADVMAGFPGETDALFKKSFERIQQLPLTYLHAFSYSPRPGTPAFEQGNPVPAERKKERITMLRELSTQKRQDFLRRNMGQTLRVLTLSKRVEKGRMLSGLSTNYITVHFPGPDDWFNTYRQVKIEAVENNYVKGIAMEIESSM